MINFENKLKGIYSDMIDICLEYVDDKADKVYIYGSCEAGSLSSDFFYCIDGEVRKKNNLNKPILCSNRGFIYDTSEDRQSQVLNILIEDIQKLKRLHDKFKKDMPTEIKLVYNVKTKELTTKFKYEEIYLSSDTLLPLHISNEWFNQVKNSID